MKGKNNPFYGLKHSEQSKMKMSISKKGKYKGSNHPQWKGGKRMFRGYISIWMPEHPHATKQGLVREHRLIMESHIGRYLKHNEVIHHIDGNRNNNDISNLSLMEKKEHDLHELRLRHGDPKNRICSECGSNKTTYSYGEAGKEHTYPLWKRHPLNKDLWLCVKCISKVRYRMKRED